MVSVYLDGHTHNSHEVDAPTQSISEKMRLVCLASPQRTAASPLDATGLGKRMLGKLPHPVGNGPRGNRFLLSPLFWFAKHMYNVSLTHNQVCRAIAYHDNSPLHCTSRWISDTDVLQGGKPVEGETTTVSVPSSVSCGTQLLHTTVTCRFFGCASGEVIVHMHVRIVGVKYVYDGNTCTGGGGGAVLKDERTNYVFFRKIANEKQWTVAVITEWTLDPGGCDGKVIVIN